MRKRQRSSSEPPPLADASEEASESHGHVEGDRLRRPEGREREENADLRRLGTSRSSQVHGCVESLLDKSEASAEAAASTAAGSASEMEERALEVFSVVESEPKRSSKTPVMSKATKGLTKTAWEVMEGLDKSLIDVLSDKYGNFDRVVGCGWLLQDAVGLPLSPLTERKVPHAIGLKARTQALKLKTAVYLARKPLLAAARKLDDADPEQQKLLEEADRVEENLLSGPMELPFDKAVENSQPRSTATSSRKVAAVPEVTPLQRRTDEAAAEVASTMKAFDVAQRVQEDAEKKYQTKGRALDRWLKLSQSRKSHSASFLESMDRAEAAYTAAQSASQNADMDTAIACIEMLVAENELLRCEKAASDALVADSLAA